MSTVQPAIDEVRAQVRALLESSPAFQALSAPDQRAFANSMVRVGAFLSRDPVGDDRGPPVGALADPGQNGQSGQSGQNGQNGQNGATRDAVDDLKARLAAKPKLIGEEFKAGAVREGVEQFGELVKKVDFPAFVSGLVNGVFKAVVDASMEQMRAYG